MTERSTWVLAKIRKGLIRDNIWKQWNIRYPNKTKKQFHTDIHLLKKQYREVKTWHRLQTRGIRPPSDRLLFVLDQVRANHTYEEVISICINTFGITRSVVIRHIIYLKANYPEVAIWKKENQTRKKSAVEDRRQWVLQQIKSNKGRDAIRNSFIKEFPTAKPRALTQDIYSLKSIPEVDTWIQNNKARRESKLGPRVIRKKGVNYWTDETEALILAYRIETESNKKNVFYSSIRPKIIMLIESVLFRYFKHFEIRNHQDMVADCEIFLHQNKIFEKFDKARSKSFSFFGTCVKNYFWSLFMNQSKNDKTFVEIDEANEFIDERFNENEYFTYLNELKSDANEILEIKLKLYKDVMYQKVLLAIKELITQTNYNRFYSSYFLLKTTGYPVASIKHILREFDMRYLLYSNHNLQFYQNLINNYIASHGEVPDYEILALEHIYEIDENKKYRIESKNRKRKVKAMA